MKLYGTPPTRVIRPMWLMNELDLDYELVPVDILAGEHMKPEFLAINPAGKLPVLVDGDLTLTESSAIQLYLAEKYPEAGLTPTDLRERAQMLRWIFFLVTEIEQPLWRIALHTVIYPENRRAPQDIPAATRDCRKMIGIFERHMQDRDFVVGDRLTVADFNAAYTLDWAAEADMLEDAPTLRAYLAKMYARPTAPPKIKEGFAAMNA